MNEITVEEAKSLIDKIGPSLGFDNTYDPVFPENRKDVCAVRRFAENGGTYGFDTIYLVWKTIDGELKHKEIKNSHSTRDRIRIESVKMEEDGSVFVAFAGGESYGGMLWEESMRVSLVPGEASREESLSFVDHAFGEMIMMIENNPHNHPLYQSALVKECMIKIEERLAAFILFEQIDTDRQTEQGEGWLGDQFRYSIWVIRGKEEPKRIYEDHAYIRPRTKSHLTGTRERDCTIKNLRIEDGLIKVFHLEGERFEEQEWEEMTFPL